MPAQSRRRSCSGSPGQGQVVYASDDHDPPAVVEESLHQRLPRAGRPSLGGVPRTQVDGQERRPRREAVGVKPVGIVGRRLGVLAGRADAHAAPAASWSASQDLGPAAVTASPRPRLGESAGRRRSGPRRCTWTSTRADAESGRIPSRRAAPAASGPRAGRGSSRRRRSAGRRRRPSTSRPAAGRPASARTITLRTSPRTSMPEVVPHRPRAVRPRLQTAESRAQRSGFRSNQVRSATQTRSTFGSPSKTSWLLGEASTSIVAAGKPPGARRAGACSAPRRPGGRAG